MKKLLAALLGGTFLIFRNGVTLAAGILPDVANGVQALSLSGQPLIAAEANQSTIENLAAATRWRQTISSGMADALLMRVITDGQSRFSARASKNIRRILECILTVDTAIFPFENSTVPSSILNKLRA